MVLNAQLGDYILLRRLAVGGQSEVFLAVKSGPRDFTRPVVIKALPSNSRDDHRLVDMFYREAFISSRFSHPNVINVHDARVVGDDHCMLMDFLNGQTVADIAQRGYQQHCPPTIRQTAQIIADAADGLSYVHDFRALDGSAYSVVHLDVSPQNIMVTYQGVGMVFDFGIAKIIGLDDSRPKLSGGKYAYMSPEQLRGENIDPRSDIFSLGIILYELCCGYRLFRRATPPEVIKAILDEPIQPPRALRPEVPEALEAIIMRALERDVYKRYQSAADFRNDLVRFLESSGEGGDLRRSLGAYVSNMFRQERAEVAAALSAAPTLEQATPLNKPLSELGSLPNGGGDPTMELLVNESVERAYAADQGDRAEQQTRELQRELERMHRRQRLLFAAVAVFALLAVVLGLSHVAGSTPSVAEEKPAPVAPAP